VTFLPGRSGGGEHLGPHQRQRVGVPVPGVADELARGGGGAGAGHGVQGQLDGRRPAGRGRACHLSAVQPN